MRNDKLKRDLNELPQDFDRDLLWSSIDLPKKKKKKRGFLLFFLIGIGLIGAFILGSESNKLFNQKDHHHSNNKVEKPLQKHPVQTSALNQNSENQEIVNSTEPEIISAEEKTNDNFSTSRNNNESKDDKPTLNKTITGEYQNSKTKEGSEGNKAKNTVRSPILHLEESSLKVNRPINKVISLAHLPNEEKPDEVRGEFISGKKKESVSLERIPSIQLLSLESDDLNITLDKDVLVYDFNPEPLNYFSLSVSSFAGISLHDIREMKPILERNQNEKGLESVGLSIFGHYNFNNIELFGGLSYVRYNTNFNFIEEENTIIQSLTGPAQESHITNYSLFNSYEYVDFVVGVGYELHLNKNWRITPSVQMGYTLNYDVQGDIFSADKWSQYRPDLNGYFSYANWQGQANLKVSRKINDTWRIGLISYLNSNKSLATNDSFSHEVYSYGMGISVSKILN